MYPLPILLLQGLFSTGAMGALAPAIFGQFRKKLRMLNKNLINTQHPQYPKYAPVILYHYIREAKSLLSLYRYCAT